MDVSLKSTFDSHSDKLDVDLKDESWLDSSGGTTTLDGSGTLLKADMEFVSCSYSDW